MKTNALGGTQIYVEDIIVLGRPAVRDLGSGPEYVAGQHRSDNTIDRQYTDYDHDAKHHD